VSTDQNLGKVRPCSDFLKLTLVAVEEDVRHADSFRTCPSATFNGAILIKVALGSKPRRSVPGRAGRHGRRNVATILFSYVQTGAFS
jgi:hypothetical protein